MRNTLISLAFILFASTACFAQQKIELTVNITSVNNGDIMVALYNSESSYLKTPYKVDKAESKSNSVIITFSDIPNGTYAITLYQDEDNNKELTKGMFGPKEPYGFSNNAKGSFGPAKFDDTKFDVKDGDVELSIDLN